MEIIVLGGAGDMGSRAVEDLAASEGVRRVTIADRNVAVAREIAARLRGQGAQVDVRQIDANNHQELVEAMRGYDAAASALGPFHLFEAKLVRAAIEAGVDYASICDEWEAARAVIDQFHEQARDKDVTIVTGLGTSPGVTNVVVRYFAERLEKTRRVDVCVYQPLNAGGGEAVIRRGDYVDQSSTFSPSISAKWAGSHVATISLCASAVAATSMSRTGRGRPRCLSVAAMLAYASATARSTGNSGRRSRSVLR